MPGRREHPDNPVPRLSVAEREDMERLQEQGDLPETIDRSTDLYFRFLLGTPARTALLRDLINSLFGALGYPLLTSVSLTDTEREPEGRGAKYTRLDLTALDDLGRTLHIEMQRDAYTHFLKRCLYYLCRNYTRHLHVRGGYGQLSPTVSISLLGFDLFEGERSLWDFVLINPGTGRRLMEKDDLLLVYLELQKAAPSLRKLRLKLKENPGHVLGPRERALVWSGYIGNDTDGLALLDESLSKDSVFSEVSEVEHQFWSAPENRYYQLRELITELDFKAIRETKLEEAKAAAAKEGRAKGIAEGRAEGERLGRQATARALLREGMASETVARLSGLSLEEVASLQEA